MAIRALAEPVLAAASAAMAGGNQEIINFI